MSNNFIRIPSIPATLLNELDISSMTRDYLRENEDHLVNASTLLQTLEDKTMYEREKRSAVESLIDLFDDQDSLDFFQEQNLARYVIETVDNTGKTFGEIPAILLKAFPIFDVIDEDADIMDNRIERRTDRVMHEMHPLYCEPKPAVIRHFLEVCPEIAFCEVGDGNYFAYLTSGGTLMAAQVAYAYLKVDECVPNNIADANTDFSFLSPVAAKELNEFFGKE